MPAHAVAVRLSAAELLATLLLEAGLRQWWLARDPCDSFFNDNPKHCLAYYLRQPLDVVEQALSETGLVVAGGATAAQNRRAILR